MNKVPRHRCQLSVSSTLTRNWHFLKCQKKTLLEVILPTTHPQNPFQDSLGIYYRKIVQIWVIYLIDMLYKYQTWTFIHPLKVKVLCDTRWKRIWLFFKQPQEIVILCVDFCCARMFTYPTKHKYWIITMWWNMCCILSCKLINKFLLPTGWSFFSPRA